MEKATIKNETMRKVPTAEQAKAVFLAETAKAQATAIKKNPALGIRNEGTNEKNHLKAFLEVADVVRGLGTFTIDHFIHYAKPLEIPFPVLKKYFESWTDSLVKQNKLTRIEPLIYDTVQFVWIS